MKIFARDYLQDYFSEGNSQVESQKSGWTFTTAITRGVLSYSFAKHHRLNSLLKFKNVWSDLLTAIRPGQVISL